MMNSDLNFAIKMVRKMDKVDRYLEYLSGDYLPGLVKKINKNFKRTRSGLFLCGVGFGCMAAYIYQTDKRINDMQERMKALEERLDKAQLGDGSTVLDDDDDFLE